MTPLPPHETVLPKDHLAAFVDGELSPEAAAQVVLHLADHPADQAYVDDLMAANAALAQAFGGALDEPVPEALRDLILRPAPKVVPFAARPRRGAVWGGLALAAGLAVAVVLPGGGAPGLVPGPLAAGDALAVALGSLPAGQVQVMADGAEVMVLGSVPTPQGFCREVEVVRADVQQLQAALACTAGSGWRVEVVIVENLAEAEAAEGFGTASGDEAQGFAPFLDRIGAGAFLSPAEEAAAMAGGWAR